MPRRQLQIPNNQIQMLDGLADCPCAQQTLRARAGLGEVESSSLGVTLFKAGSLLTIGFLIGRAVAR